MAFQKPATSDTHALAVIFSDTMDTFRVKFNPIIPLVRFIWTVAAGALLTRIFYVCFTKLGTDTTRAFWVFIIGVPIVGTLFYIPLKGLFKNSKIYWVTNSHLIVTDILKLKTERIEKENIKGFSDSRIEYRIGTFKQLIIYLVDNRKFEIMQFEQFNFKQIKPTMIDFGYRYFGPEPYTWKWFDSRVYYFE